MFEQSCLAPRSTEELQSQVNFAERQLSMLYSENFSEFLPFESARSNGSSLEEGSLSVGGSDALLPGLDSSFEL